LTSISKTACVPFSADEMYELVYDMEEYPSFLPWCSESRIERLSDSRFTAFLSVAVGRIRQSFSTENTIQPGRRIDILLLHGPFRHLNGYWQFEPDGEQSCRISVHMDFEFRNRLVKMALDKVFSHIINTMIDTFTKRAYVIYGRR